MVLRIERRYQFLLPNDAQTLLFCLQLCPVQRKLS
jgi:hypothetical protein